MFLIYIMVVIITAIVLRWPWWITVLALLAAIPPLVTVPLEIWLRKRGHLTTRYRRSSVPRAELAS